MVLIDPPFKLLPTMGKRTYLNYKVFTHKELLKDYKELLELHKRCIKTYLVSKSLEYPTIRKFFVIYDTYIDEENILKYFFLPIKYFVNSLILYKLQNIKFYGKTKSKAKGRKIQR